MAHKAKDYIKKDNIKRKVLQSKLFAVGNMAAKMGVPAYAAVLQDRFEGSITAGVVPVLKKQEAKKLITDKRTKKFFENGGAVQRVLLNFAMEQKQLTVSFQTLKALKEIGGTGADKIKGSDLKQLTKFIASIGIKITPNTNDSNFNFSATDLARFDLEAIQAIYTALQVLNTRGAFKSGKTLGRGQTLTDNAKKQIAEEGGVVGVNGLFAQYDRLVAALKQPTIAGKTDYLDGGKYFQNVEEWKKGWDTMKGKSKYLIAETQYLELYQEMESYGGILDLFETEDQNVETIDATDVNLMKSHKDAFEKGLESLQKMAKEFAKDFDKREVLIDEREAVAKWKARLFDAFYEALETPASVAKNPLDQLLEQLQLRTKNLITNIAIHFDVDNQPSLNPLSALVKVSNAFWSKIDASKSLDNGSLTEKAYTAYADLEKAMYNHWAGAENIDDTHIDFIMVKAVKVFSGLFRGKNNTEHGGFGSGKKLHAFAKSYNVYQEINAVRTELDELSEKYEGSEELQADVNGLGHLVEDTKTLLKSGYTLRGLISTHYKNADVRDRLLDALASWEAVRALMMKELTPYLIDCYDVFHVALMEKETAREVAKEAIDLVKNISNIEGLLPKFKEMDIFRQKIEKLDTEKRLSQKLEAMRKAEKQLKEFVEGMKGLTTEWANANLKKLVQRDEALIASNQALEQERTTLNIKLEELQKKKAASLLPNWKIFWESHDKERIDFEKQLQEIQLKVEENRQKRQELDQAFKHTYDGFSDVLKRAEI